MLKTIFSHLVKENLTMYLQIHTSHWRHYFQYSFNEGRGNVISTLKQRWNNFVQRWSSFATLFQRCFNVGFQSYINMVQRWKSDVEFCLIFNVASTLLQCWSITLNKALFRRWNVNSFLPPSYREGYPE